MCQEIEEATKIIQKITVKYQPFFTLENVRTLERLMTNLKEFSSVIKKCETREKNQLKERV